MSGIGLKMPDWLKNLTNRMQPPARNAGAGRRVYAVGDIHGCLAELKLLKALILADNVRRAAAAVTLVYVGDYVDRGPDSKGVLDEVRRPLEGVAATIHLMGNHEAMMAQFLADPRRGMDWLVNGGSSTLASFGINAEMARRGFDLDATRDALAAAMSPRQVEFVEGLALSARIGDCFFCHAGVRPGVALDAQSNNDLLWIREPFLSSREDFGALVVHGHTPMAAPEVRRNRINIDTACFATGRLTAAVFDVDIPVSFLSTPGRSKS
jgi:serine/threonine protein phosphatase 1